MNIWFVLRRVMIVVAWCAVPVSSAQEPPAKTTPLVGMIGLIVKEPVLNELGIAKDSSELAEIRKVLKPFSTVLQQRLSQPTDEDRASRLNPQDLYAKVEAEFVAELKQKLKSEQFTRLQQIHWQRWGIRSIEDEQVAQTLDLSQEQLARLAAIRLHHQARQKQLEGQQRELRGQGGNVEEFKQKFLDLDQERLDQYNQILTADQLAKFEELIGKPFELVESKPSVTNSTGMPIRTRPGGLMSLAIMEPVLKELGIDHTSPQVLELSKLSKAHSQDLRQQLTSENPVKDIREKTRLIEANLQAKYDAELKKLLTSEQMRRLQEIHLQQMGTQAFSHADVVTTLQISKEQQLKIEGLVVDVLRKSREWLNPPGGGRPVGDPVSEEIQKKIQEAVEEMNSKADQILTKSQREKWEEMKGKPFDLTRLRRSAMPR